MGDIDVELVPGGAPGVLPAAPVSRARPTGRTRRKFFLLVGGAVSVAAAVAVGGIVASGGVMPFLHRLGISDDDESPPDEKK
jgi:hypothetical protein